MRAFLFYALAKLIVCSSCYSEAGLTGQFHLMIFKEQALQTCLQGLTMAFDKLQCGGTCTASCCAAGGAGACTR